jgi:predicted ribosomally synthesized peptide with SipW-like signal peptide
VVAVSDGSITVTRRRLLGSIVTIGAASAAAGAGTFAAFSDTELSGGNAVRAGTLNLDFGGGASFTFSTSLYPTQTVSDSVTLVSNGSVQGSLDVDVSYSENDASGNATNVSAQQMAQNLEVTGLTYGGTDVRGQIASSASPPTVHDLATTNQTSGESTGNDLVDLADPGTGTAFAVDLRLKDVGNDFQSDGIDIEFTFTLNQTDGQ